ncbi:AAA family ATPase [Capillimicrobium parvum]|uniref:Uncharacterized protein n=1 Tax=Capillimicrobium parvum TaxID=2884022 RepID=A0A9E6Y005_9ACTN|nr:AAA family ATPase [Capillimicrobium parvum]UGS37599.1 hypothetical protein DSM104329_04016 [Capillimicrobium parvum]
MTSWIDGLPTNPLAEDPEPLPALAGFPFLHAGAGAVIVGPTGGGRSSLVQAGAYDAARAGLRVAYLGSEVTASEWNARARDLPERRGDAIDDELVGELERVRYLELSSVLVQAWDEPDAWARDVPPAYDVVVIDPLSAVASALDLDFDSSNAEFVQFYDRLVQPLVGAGVAVVMLDNGCLRARGPVNRVPISGPGWWSTLERGFPRRRFALEERSGALERERPAGLERHADVLALRRAPGTRRRQAEREMRRLMEAAVPVVVARLTVADAGHRLLDHLTTLGRKRSTLEGYESYLRIHLAPYFGDRALERITGDDVEAFVAHCRRHGQSVKSKLNYLGLLPRSLTTPCVAGGRRRTRASSSTGPGPRAATPTCTSSTRPSSMRSSLPCPTTTWAASSASCT